MYFHNNIDKEPKYFRKPFPDNEPFYFYYGDYDSKYIPGFPYFCKAYKYDDERRTKYQDYAEKYITSIFGTGKKLKKPYMKILDEYLIITDSNQYVIDYNKMVEGLQKWCRINHITYRAIGEPSERMAPLKSLYESARGSLNHSKREYEIWDNLRIFCEKQTAGPEAVKLGKSGVNCSCFTDVDDGYYSWSIDFHNIGYIGKHRLAIKTEFDKIEYWHFPTKLPDVHVSLYLTYLPGDYPNPWAEGKISYPLHVDQISDDCRKTISRLIYSAIEDFDRKHQKFRPFDDMDETWGENYFRRIKEDFNPVNDIKILFEDGTCYYNNLPPKETLEKNKKFFEELDSFYNKYE